MSALTPPLFDSFNPEAGWTPTGVLRPFGLTTAVHARPEAARDLAGGLTLCPDRQITVTDDGTPFIHAPSMESKFTTTAQTTEDMQLDTETENDTD